jgi:hypothetical protein
MEEKGDVGEKQEEDKQDSKGRKTRTKLAEEVAFPTFIHGVCYSNLGRVTD